MSSKSMQMGSVARPSFLKAFVKSQFLTKIPRAPEGTDLTGQAGIITGGSSGLGLEAARHLLSLKLSRLILAVRSSEKGQAVADELTSTYPCSEVDVWALEMTSYTSIQSFVERVDKELPRLDFAILNAGVFQPTFELCSTGHEKVIQVNYLSTFLLAILLLPVSKTKSPAGRPGRLTIISSGTTGLAKLPNRDRRPFLASFDDTRLTPFEPPDRYFTSKLLGHLFFARLLDYLNPDEVVVNLVEPGSCKGSSLHRDFKGPLGIFLETWKNLTGRRAEDGAWTYVDGAVLRGKDSHGNFLEDCEVHPFSPLVYSSEGKAVSNALWDETLTELDFAGVRGILEESRQGRKP